MTSVTQSGTRPSVKATQKLAMYLKQYPDKFPDEAIIAIAGVAESLKHMNQNGKMQTLDEIIKSVDDLRLIPCHHCKTSDCCFHTVDVNPAEAATILKVVARTGKTFPDFIGDAGKKRFEAQALVKSPAEFNALPVEMRQCIFLQENLNAAGEYRCSIYAVRPARCRAHFAFNTVDQPCTKFEDGSRVKMFINYGIEIYISALYNLYSFSPMAQAIFNLFVKDKK